MLWKCQEVGTAGHKRVPQEMQDGGRTLHLSILISGRYSNHPTNVIFSPKRMVTQMLCYASLWILSRKYVIILINCISPLMCYMNSLLLLSFASSYGGEV
jgi:hypothetical protein